MPENYFYDTYTETENWCNIWVVKGVALLFVNFLFEYFRNGDESRL